MGSSSTYVPVGGDGASLNRNEDGSFTLVDPDGSLYSFASPSSTTGAGLLQSLTRSGIHAITTVYDLAGRPHSIITGAGSTCNNYDSYGFDAAGFRRQRTTSATTRYLLGGLLETNASGTITTADVDGPAGDLAHYAGPPTTSSTASYLYYNGHGDLAATADKAGDRANAYTYDPNGNPVQSTRQTRPLSAGRAAGTRNSKALATSSKWGCDPTTPVSAASWPSILSKAGQPTRTTTPGKTRSTRTTSPANASTR